MSINKQSKQISIINSTYQCKLLQRQVCKLNLVSRNQISVQLFRYLWAGNPPATTSGVHKNVYCLRDFFSSDKLSKKVCDIIFFKYNSLVLAFHDEQSVQVIWSHSYINFSKEKLTEYYLALYLAFSFSLTILV